MKASIFLSFCIITCTTFATPEHASFAKSNSFLSVNVSEDFLQAGIELFNKGNYTEAIKAFKKAQEAMPSKQDVYLWLGIAYVAAGDKSMAHNSCLRMPVETEAMVMTMYLKGLTEWKEGKVADASYWFRNAANYPKAPASTLSRQALTQMDKGEAAPPVSQWPALASLTSSKKEKAAPKSGPAEKDEKITAVKRLASLPLGTYQCYDSYTELNESTKITYKEKLIILDKTTYEYRSGKFTRGKYKYDEASGKITFTSGPYAGGNPTVRLSYRTGDNKPVITLSYSFKNLGSDEDFCILVAQ